MSKILMKSFKFYLDKTRKVNWIAILQNNYVFPPKKSLMFFYNFVPILMTWSCHWSKCLSLFTISDLFLSFSPCVVGLMMKLFKVQYNYDYILISWTIVQFLCMTVFLICCSLCCRTYTDFPGHKLKINVLQTYILLSQNNLSLL